MLPEAAIGSTGSGQVFWFSMSDLAEVLARIDTDLHGSQKPPAVRYIPNRPTAVYFLPF